MNDDTPDDVIILEQQRFAFYASCITLRLAAQNVPNRKAFLKQLVKDWSRSRKAELRARAQYLHSHKELIPEIDVEDAHVETVKGVNAVTKQINEIFDTIM